MSFVVYQNKQQEKNQQNNLKYQEIEKWQKGNYKTNYGNSWYKCEWPKNKIKV